VTVKRLLTFAAGLSLVVVGLVGFTTAASRPPRAGAAASACPLQVNLLNGGFEQPDFGAPGYYQVNPTTGSNHNGLGPYPPIPGWQTTDSFGEIEIWQQPGPVPGSPVPADEGIQYAELNANSPSTLYQEIPTTPGQVLYWGLSHRGRVGVDTMSLHLGPAGVTGPVIQTMSDGPAAWGHYTGTYIVPPGQTTTRFAFTADSSDGGLGSLSVGNFLDDVSFGTPPCLTIDKSVTPSTPVNPGDVLTYHLTVKNAGGADAENTVLHDTIPTGATYVPGSLAITAGPGTGAISDPADGDRGEVVGNTVTVRLGNAVTASGGTLPNTDTVPETDVSFQVQVDGTAALVSNTATASYETSIPAGPSTFTSTSNTADAPVTAPTTTSTSSTSTSTTSTSTTSTSTTTAPAPTTTAPPPVTTTTQALFPTDPTDPFLLRQFTDPPIHSDPPGTEGVAPADLASTGTNSRSTVGIAFASIGLGLMILALRGRRLLG
jgi:uncharacterized repeat protein (TIGR01451 family)